MTKRQGLIFSLIVLVAVFALAFSLTQAQDFGTGWSGTFFPSNNLTGTGTPVTNINGLNFNWGTGVPVVNGVPVLNMHG